MIEINGKRHKGDTLGEKATQRRQTSSGDGREWKIDEDVVVLRDAKLRRP